MSATIVELCIPTQAENKPCSLTCPCCGDTYLRHSDVTVWVRPVEDGPAHRVHVFPDGTYEKWDGRNNPSARRGAVGIYFSCENCRRLLQLTFAQHKGETDVVWQVIG